MPDNEVIELPNRSPLPDSSFNFTKGDLRIAMERYSMTDELLAQTTLWHSHPGGGIGPSRVDMNNKLPMMSHLVVTLVDDELVPTWY